VAEIAGNKREYVDPADLKDVEAAQLTYTLTRPDVYNAILAVPGYFWMSNQSLTGSLYGGLSLTAIFPGTFPAV
jgi:hypothetical protein